MKKYQETIYKFILYFSALINLFLIGLLFLVLRDSFSGEGDYGLEGKSFWFFVAIISAYSTVNSILLIQISKNNSEIQPQISAAE